MGFGTQDVGGGMCVVAELVGVGVEDMGRSPVEAWGGDVLSRAW
jgi:hypothetical protein